MLKIRQEQFAALGANVEKKFKRQMCEQLRACSEGCASTDSADARSLR